MADTMFRQLRVSTQITQTINDFQSNVEGHRPERTALTGVQVLQDHLLFKESSLLPSAQIRLESQPLWLSFLFSTADNQGGQCQLDTSDVTQIASLMLNDSFNDYQGE
jgi:hypothetical protein